MLTVSRIKSLASRFNQTRSSFARKPSRFVGIDVGVREVTLTSIDAKSNRPISSSNLPWQSTHRSRITIDPTTAPTPEWVTDTIQALLERLPRCIDGENNLTAISLPIPWVHHQVVLGHDIAASQLQCDEMFRNSIFQSSAQLAHWPIVGYQHGQPNEDDQYVVAAVAERAACQVASAIASIGYNVDSVLPHGVALAQAAKPLTSVPARCVAMLNRDGGSVAIDHGTGCGLCRSLPGLPSTVLEHADDGPLVLEEVRPWLSDIAAEITATIRYSDRANMCTTGQEPILVCGDSCRIPDLDKVLSRLTQRPVSIWYSGSREGTHSNQHSYHPSHQPSSALACSLAYCAMRSYKQGAGQ